MKVALSCGISVLPAFTVCYICAEAVRRNCRGDARGQLESACMELPDKDCYEGPDRPDQCEKYEVSCGNDQCVNGLALCDREKDCYNGGDERLW